MQDDPIGILKSRGLKTYLLLAGILILAVFVYIFVLAYWAIENSPFSQEFNSFIFIAGGWLISLATFLGLWKIGTRDLATLVNRFGDYDLFGFLMFLVLCVYMFWDKYNISERIWRQK